MKQSTGKRGRRDEAAEQTRPGSPEPVSAESAECAPGEVGPPPPGSVPFHSVGFAVSSIGYATARRFRETLAPLKLEPREFALLRGVNAAEGQSQQAIGERLQIPPSRMVAFVDALEARGLLERRPNPQDRRSWALFLTRDGHEVLDSAFTLASGLEQSLCAGLSSAEREQLIDFLQRIGECLGVPAGSHAASAAEHHAPHAAGMATQG